MSQNNTLSGFLRGTWGVKITFQQIYGANDGLSGEAYFISAAHALRELADWNAQGDWSYVLTGVEGFIVDDNWVVADTGQLVRPPAGMAEIFAKLAAL